MASYHKVRKLQVGEHTASGRWEHGHARREGRMDKMEILREKKIQKQCRKQQAGPTFAQAFQAVMTHGQKNVYMLGQPHPYAQSHAHTCVQQCDAC